jgi:hypothetical protein
VERELPVRETEVAVAERELLIPEGEWLAAVHRRRALVPIRRSSEKTRLAVGVVVPVAVRMSRGR